MSPNVPFWAEISKNCVYLFKCLFLMRLCDVPPLFKEEMMGHWWETNRIPGTARASREGRSHKIRKGRLMRHAAARGRQRKWRESPRKRWRETRRGSNASSHASIIPRRTKMGRSAQWAGRRIQLAGDHSFEPVAPLLELSRGPRERCRRNWLGVRTTICLNRREK